MALEEEMQVSLSDFACPSCARSNSSRARKASRDYFATYGRKAAHNLRVRQTARPEGAEKGYDTGGTHFTHVNDPSYVTLLFIAGGKDGGSNTFLSDDQWTNAQDYVNIWTWLSAYTLADDDEVSVKHYVV